MILILSLVHGPLPQPDFHNIRHQDNAGQVCDYHDHLLRWHPGAGIASDVAVLHWHWFLPTAESDVFGAEPDGPGVHAHAPDCDAVVDNGPQISVDTSVRLDLRLPSLTLADLAIDTLPGTFTLPRPALKWAPSPLDSNSARRHPLQVLLNRWTC